MTTHRIPPDHDAAETIAGGPVSSEGPGSRTPLRNAALAGMGLLLFILVFFTSYGGAFGSPRPHDLRVAATGPSSVVSALGEAKGVTVFPVDDPAKARAMVRGQEVGGAIRIIDERHVEVTVARGAGSSVATALTKMARQLADRTGASLSVVDEAPLSAENPNGTFEFYAIVFLGVGCSLGATIFGRILGPVRGRKALLERLAVSVVFTAAAAGLVTTLLVGVLGALPDHPVGVFLTLWGFALAVTLTISGIAAALGTLAGLAATLAFVMLGNTSAGGAVARPLLNTFYSALTPLLPHGAALSVLRDVQYFDHQGIAGGVTGLLVWCGLGLLFLAVGALRPILETPEPEQ